VAAGAAVQGGADAVVRIAYQVAVGPQRERRIMVAERRGHGADVHPTGQQGRGVRVAELVVPVDS
jgi:hypothetical protein